MDEDAFLARLKRKDELIQELKQSLLEKDQRIGELEIALAESIKATNGRTAQIVEQVGPHTSETSSREHAAVPNLGTSEPKYSDIIVHQASRGLFPDGWSGLEATLVLNPDLAGRTVEFSFYLPPSARADPKEATITSNFTAPHAFEVRRSHLTRYAVTLPNRVTSPPFLVLTVNEPEPLGDDKRALGVFLHQAVVKSDEVNGPRNP